MIDMWGCKKLIANHSIIRWDSFLILMWYCFVNSIHWKCQSDRFLGDSISSLFLFGKQVIVNDTHNSVILDLKVGTLLCMISTSKFECDAQFKPNQSIIFSLRLQSRQYTQIRTNKTAAAPVIHSTSAINKLNSNGISSMNSIDRKCKQTSREYEYSLTINN